ncbi:unnamed protein product [Prorocentrum cordatum]|uniref:Meiosis-specific nuclear structural protein 1 n=1 Tax=Prorocentrum cordatum TaxID=2364126 RepID=A0ABN9WR84_9DINO|nr:unnamed protein product [Polarella glacialis]
MLVVPRCDRDSPREEECEDVLAQKREANIRQREECRRLRHAEAVAQKKAAWQREAEGREGRLQGARAARRQELQEALAQRAAAAQERRQKDLLREHAIDQKLRSWEDRENQRLHQMCAEAEQAKMLKASSREHQKSLRLQAAQEAAARRAEERRRRAELERRREESLARREAERQARAPEGAPGDPRAPAPAAAAP